MNEKDFINNLKSGSEKAFAQLVEDYQGLVTNTCYSFVMNKDDADDLAQEVFVEAYHGLKNFREDAKVSTWLYRIAVNKSIDEIRKKTRKKRFAYLSGLFGKDDQPLPLFDLSQNDPHQEMEAAQRLQILNSAIDQLPNKQAIAFRLSKFEGLSGKDIADVMETSLASVEALIHRAKTSLKKQLADFYKKGIF